MAAGTSQESRLAIVIDTRDSEARIKRLRDALNGLGGTANNAGAGANAAGAGAQRLGRDASGATTAIQRMTQSMGALSGAFAAFASVAGAMSIIKTADAMQSLNSKIKLATNSSEEYLAVQGRLRDIAQANLTQYDSLVELYSSSRRALKQLGKTQNETLLFTENITKAMFVGGGAAASQSAALVQLSQSLQSGVLRGEEFNSISEQAPIILELIADKLGVAQGALRKMAADGKISAKVVSEAVSEATEKLDEMVAKMPATMTQALETVKNQYKFFIDDMLNATGGFSSIVANALLGLGQNLNSLIPILVAGGIAWGAYALATSAAVTTGIASAISGMATMGGWMLFNSLLIKAQILSFSGLSAVMSVYGGKVAAAALAIKAKATAMAQSLAITALSTAAIVRNGDVMFTLTMAARSAATAIVQKVAAMRAGVTVAGVYAASLRGVAGAAGVAAASIKGLGLAFASLGKIIMAHPIMIIGSVLLAFVAASKNAEGKILGLSGAFSSLGDAVKVLGYVLVDIIGGIKDVASTFGRFIVSMISNSEKGANESSAMFQIFFGNTESGFVGMLQVMARFADLAGATMKTLVEAIGRGFGNMLTDVSNKFASLGNSIIEIMNKVTKAITGVVNGGLDLISGMVSIANKIPFVNIADDKRRSVAKTIETRFNDNKKLDTRGFVSELGKNYGSFSNDGMANRLQGHIDSMKGAKLEATANLDLAGAITATGDESDKAKKKKVKNAKKVKEAVDKEAEAYKRLIETYTQQKATYDKMVWDLDAPFATEMHDLAFELEHASGKFFALPQHLKKNLADMAKSLDVLKVQNLGEGMFLDLKKELELLGNGNTNPLKELLYDLNDAKNVLSTLNEELKTTLILAAIDVDVKKHKLAMTDMLKDTQKQLNLLNAIDDLDRQKMEVEYESLDILEKFNYLTKIGQQDKYDELKASLDVLTASKLRLAVETKQVEATKGVYDTVKDLNKEIALFDSTDAMAEFYYDLEKTDKYLHATKQSVIDLEQALLKLKGLKATTALDGLMSELTIESPLETLRTQYQERMAVVEEFERAHNLMLGTLTEERLAIDKAYTNARGDLMLTQGETLFGNLAGLSKTFLGEQSGLYKSLFAVEKAYTLASVLLKNKEAISKAWASAAFPYNLPAVAAAVAGTAGIVSAVQGIMPQGFKQGGYTGNMGASQVAGVVHGQEYVFDAQSTKRIGVDNLNAMRSGKSVGETKVIVNNYSNEKANVQTTLDGDTIVTIGQIAHKVAVSVVNQNEIKKKRQGWK